MKRTLKKVLALALCLALGLGLIGSAFAADEQTGKFDLETICTDDGQYVCKVVIHLDKATEATAEDLKDVFTVTIKDYSQNFYGWPVEGDFTREINAIDVSEDGMTVTLDLATNGAFPDSLSYKASYVHYTETGYVVEAEGYKLTFSGKTVDPEADKWGKVAYDEKKGTYAYRWFDPSAGYDKPEAGYPIVVWLHGVGEVGQDLGMMGNNNYDNNAQLTANRVTAWGQAATQDLFGGAYVIAPQTGKVGNEAFGWTPENVIATIESFIKSVGEENVDRSRIVIGGCSMGGIGTWAVIRAYPDYFAAAFPVCGMVINTFDPTDNMTTEEKLALKQLPIYMIHTIEDGTVNITGTLDAYDALTAVGKTNIYMALYEHVWTIGTPDETPEDLMALSYNGHSSWVYAHNDIDGVKPADKYFMKEYTVGEGDAAKTYTSTKPSDLGYATFKAWLAGQVNPHGGVYYTVEKEVAAFGEVVTGVTIHGLERISRTVKADEWAKQNKPTVTIKDHTVTDMATGAATTADYVRTPEKIVINEDRTSVTLKFAPGQAWVGAADNTPDLVGKYVVTLGGAQLPCGGEHNAEVEAFESLTYTVPAYSNAWTGETFTTMSARGFTPDKETYKAEKYPLIIWLHGVGEVGTDNRIQISANDVPAWTEKATQDLFGGAYVLAIQNHAAYSHVACKSVIDQFIAAKGDIDETRVYIGGCSMGGGATWTMIKEYPHFFAAAFPICMGGDLTETDVANLKDLPIYMTVSSGDSAGIVTGMIESYNQLKEAGSENVHITIFEHSEWAGGETLASLGVYIDHWSWTYAHNDYDAKGDDFDGKQFIDTSKDGEYNDGIVTVKEGILTYKSEVTTDYMGQPIDEPYTLEATLNGVNERPEDAGYATFKAWIADQTNENPSPFKDVAPDDEIFDAVMALYKAGVTKGTSGNTYEPESTLTRSEFVTFLARAAKADIDPNAEPVFEDLTESWYYGTVAWSVEKGLILGYGDGRFGPEDEVTTEQVNLIVERLLAKDKGFTPADGQLFEDADETPATRGQVASIINALVVNHK